MLHARKILPALCNVGAMGAMMKSLQKTMFLGANATCQQQQQTRSIDTLYSQETCEDCVNAYKLPKLKGDFKKRPHYDSTKDKTACWQTSRRTEFKCRTDPEFDIHFLIDRKKGCFEDQCGLEFPPHDLTLYRRSDKLERKYQRTWNKCVVKRRRRKQKCVAEPPKLKRRNKRAKCEKKDSACDRPRFCLAAPDLKLATCVKKPKNTKCPPLAMLPGCKAGRKPPTCKRTPKSRNCRKRLTKYPSFSECLIDPLPEAPITECNCLATPSMCSVWEFYRKKKS